MTSIIEQTLLHIFHNSCRQHINFNIQGLNFIVAIDAELGPSSQLPCFITLMDQHEKWLRSGPIWILTTSSCLGKALFILYHHFPLWHLSNYVHWYFWIHRASVECHINLDLSECDNTTGYYMCLNVWMFKTNLFSLIRKSATAPRIIARNIYFHVLHNGVLKSFGQF